MTELARARRAAGMSQRALAARAGVPQSTVGRIEAGLMDPRVSTLERLLRECNAELVVTPRPGEGIDRTQFRERFKLSPRERVEYTAQSARAMDEFRRRARRLA